MSIEFIGDNWYLFVALAIILALLIHNIVTGNKGSIDPVTATELINHKDAIVIDVRSAADFSKGHVINAINVPFNGLKNQIGTLQKHKDRPIVVNCRSGSQSSVACQQLRKKGFTEVYNLSGGLMAWQNAGLPLTRKKR